MRLTIDPGGAKLHVIAVWDDDWALRRIDFGLPASNDWLAGHVWMERPYRGAVNLLAAGHLCGRLGIDPDDVRWVSPRTWQARFAVRGPKPRRKADRPQYAVHLAVRGMLDAGEIAIYDGAVTGARDLTDVADAVAIGLAISGRAQMHTARQGDTRD